MMTLWVYMIFDLDLKAIMQGEAISCESCAAGRILLINPLSLTETTLVSGGH